MLDKGLSTRTLTRTALHEEEPPPYRRFLLKQKSSAPCKIIYFKQFILKENAVYYVFNEDESGSFALYED